MAGRCDQSEPPPSCTISRSPAKWNRRGREDRAGRALAIEELATSERYAVDDSWDVLRATADFDDLRYRKWIATGLGARSSP